MLQDDHNIDQHGRQTLLSTYVQYQCKIPHPLCSSDMVGSRSGSELDR